jgi:HEAT repeat protein
MILRIFAAGIVAGIMSAASSQDRVEREQIERWIRELGDEDYTVREAATQSLIDARDRALAPAQAAQALTTDPEVKSRLDRVLWCLKRQAAAADFFSAQAPKEYLKKNPEIHRRLENGTLTDGEFDELLAKVDAETATALIRLAFRDFREPPPWGRIHAGDAPGLLIQRASLRQGEGVPVEEFAALLAHQDAHVRASAVIALGNKRAKEYIPRIVRLLQDRDDRVRVWALRVLAKFKEKHVIPAVLKSLETASPEVELAAVLALGRLEADEFVKEMVKRSSGADENTRTRWLDGLRTILDAGQAAAAIARFLDDPSERIRCAALSILGTPRCKGAWNDVVRRSKTGTASERKVAIRTLAAMDPENAVAPIVQRLEDKQPDVIDRALRELGTLQAKVAVPAILKLLQDDNPDVRFYALDALGRLGAEDAWVQVVKRLEDKTAYVRQSALSTLGRLEVKDAWVEVVKRLEDEEECVRQSALGTLGQLGVKDAVPAIARHLKDEDPATLASALYALAQLHAKEFLPEFLDRMQHEEDEVGEAAAYALAISCGESAIPRILPLLKHEHASVRHRALLAMQGRHAVSAEPDVRKLLSDPKGMVRFAAIQALAEIGSGESIPEIVKLLEDEDAFVRDAAIRGLAVFKSRESVPAIVERLSDENDNVRFAAVYALQTLGGRTALARILEFLEHPSEGVRMGAIWALKELETKGAKSARIEEAIPGIRKRLRDSDYSVRSMAVQVLGEWGVRDAAPEILRILQEATRELREPSPPKFASSVAGVTSEILDRWEMLHGLE